MKKRKRSKNAAPQTVEEKEIQARIDTAEKASFKITALEKEFLPFSNYDIVGEKKVRYSVELRSFDEKINSCNCPDYQVNTLGTCKHIEGVLKFAKKLSTGRLKDFKKSGSSRTEVFMNPQKPDICIRWPNNKDNLAAIRQFLEPYITSSEELLADPATSVTSIYKALQEAHPNISSKIRISKHLLNWSEKKLLEMDRQEDRRLFLADVAAGKRSLQMLSCCLFPYQEEGMLHLAFNGRAILADEMGLGKTIQAIAASELLRRLNRAQRILIITPASLKGEWDEQIQRFSGLKTLIINGSRPERLFQYKQESFFYLVNYEQVRSDYDEIQNILKPDVIILDEAQRIKNWKTKTAWAVKQLHTPYAFVLTGTPIENRLEELYSIMQIVDPKVFGPLFKFHQEFFEYNSKGNAVSHINLDRLHERLKPVLLRRRKKDVEEQLPERTVSNFLVQMTDIQRSYYLSYEEKVAKLLVILKKRPFTEEESKRLQQFLACMRMIADTPYILDPNCRDCPKLEELEEVLTGLMEEGDNKVIIFSEWERMLDLIRQLADEMGWEYAWHTGSVPQSKRREDITRFKTDPGCKLFLTTDSGSTGLNLQVANVVINMDLPWNPAKLEQRIARAWRKNQTRTVQVLNLISENTIEQRMLMTLASKQAIADAVLDREGSISEIPLPSASRDEFIKRLEAIVGLSADYQVSNKNPLKKSPEKLKQDIIARHSDKIHLLELKEEVDTLLAVVDKVDATIKKDLEETAETTVEVMDFETYALLQRLAAKGFIAFNQTENNKLFTSHLLQCRDAENRKQQLSQACIFLNDAERKLKMANLLKSGGFLEEALPAAQEAMGKGLEIMKLLEFSIDSIPAMLKEQHIQEPAQYIEQLSAWITDLSEMLARYTLGL